MWLIAYRQNQLVPESFHPLQDLLPYVLVKQRDHPSLRELLFAPLVIPVERQKEE